MRKIRDILEKRINRLMNYIFEVYNLNKENIKLFHLNFFTFIFISLKKNNLNNIS